MFNKLFKVLSPQGNMHKEYFRYMKWSFATNMFASVEYAMSTHCMLSAISNTSELSMTANFIGKDAIGQLGSLFYIGKITNTIDTNTKSIVRNSMIAQQLSMGSLCITPFVPLSMFLPLAAAGNIFTNVSFACIGAVNAKVIRKLSIDDDMGEIYGKLTIVNTLGSTVGTGIGLICVAAIPDHSTRMCLLPFIAVLRVYSYYKTIDGLI
jgi:hypothetical protein